MAARWPDGRSVLLAPGEAAAEGLELGAPSPCTAGGVAYWALGGPSKARLRILEDERKLLQLGQDFTVGIAFRAGAGGLPGHDSLMLGHDNKHWLALEGVKRTLAVIDADSTGQTISVKHAAAAGDWTTVYLQPLGGSQTAVLAADADGLVEVGTVGISLVGSRLRNLGWASNEVQVASVALWTRCLSWGEMAKSVAREMPAPAPPDPGPPAKPKRKFRGQVVDTSGAGLGQVTVSWSTGGCLTDEDGCFEASLSDAETDVPETAETGSQGSASSWASLGFSREGFAPVAMPAQDTGGEQLSMQVTLRPVSASASISAESGGSVTDPASGSSISVPPNGLCYPDGSPVTGQVTVSLSVIDATDPASLASMPGDFTAVAADGSQVFLQSLGAAWVGAVDEAGRELAVNPASPGVTLDLQSTAAVDSEKLGALPDMWTFDEATGKWELEETGIKVDGQDMPNPSRPEPTQSEVEEGEGPERYKSKRYAKKRAGKKASYKPEGQRVIQGHMSVEDFKKKVASSAKKSISATVTKMGYINCDVAYSHPTVAVMIAGQVLRGGLPVSNSQLVSAGRDYGGRCFDATDSEGKFSRLVAQFDSEIDIEVHLREEVTDGKKLEVFFGGNSSRLIGKAEYPLLSIAVGQHVRSADGGGMAWTRLDKNTAVGLLTHKSEVAWCKERRRWQHTVDGQLVFVRDDASPEPSPFGPDWRVAPSFQQSVGPTVYVPVPTYARAVSVKKQLVGPFKTGKPGDVMDFGEIVVP